MELAAVFLIALVGAFLQSNIGFGFPILAMVFLPSIFPFNTAVTLNQIIAMASTGWMTFRYRKHIRWNVLLPMTLSSILLAQVIILMSLNVESSVLTLLLGICLILLSVYFMVFSERLQIKASKRNAVLMGMTAGLGNGLFGIGGPPIALYLSSAVEDKYAYLSTIQAYFFISNIHSITVRVLSGTLQFTHLGYILAGWFAVAIGTFVGLSVFKHIPKRFFKRIVYCFVGCSGLWIVAEQLLRSS